MYAAATVSQGARLVAFDPDPGQLATGYMGNIVLVALDYPGLSLEYLVQATAQTLEAMVPGSELLSYEMIDDLNGRPAGRIEMTDAADHDLRHPGHRSFNLDHSPRCRASFSSSPCSPRPAGSLATRRVRERHPIPGHHPALSIRARPFSMPRPAEVSMTGPRIVRAPRGSVRTCKSWLIEAAYRMIQNNLDPDVAERPQDLVVYGGRGQAARDWTSFDAILASLRDSGGRRDAARPVGQAGGRLQDPRRRARASLIANSNLVPHWATQDHFDELAAKGLIMFGQMTAGSWIYIGTQGILQGTYETLGSARPAARLAVAEGQVRPDAPAWAAWAAPSHWRSR